MIDNFFAKVDVQLPPTPPQSRVRQEFFTYHGTAVPRLSPADVIRIFSRFAAVCPQSWQITPPGDEVDSSSSVASYGHVHLFAFSADVTADPQEEARQQARRIRAGLYGTVIILALVLILLVILVPAFPAALVSIVKAVGVAIATFGVAGGVASLITGAVLAIVDPVIPVLDVDLQRASVKARRLWISSQQHLVTLAVAYARDEAAADAEWRADWREALTASEMAAQMLFEDGLLTPGELQFLCFHYDAMIAWPALYCRDFMPVEAAEMVGVPV